MKITDEYKRGVIETLCIVKKRANELPSISVDDVEEIDAMTREEFEELIQDLRQMREMCSDLEKRVARLQAWNFAR